MTAGIKGSAGIGSPKPTLLLVLPGYEGRKPVLEKILKIADIVAIAFSDCKRSCWVKRYVNGYIEIPQGSGDAFFQSSAHIVDLWLKSRGVRLDGVMCYDEYGVELSAFLCDKYNLPGTPFSTMKLFRNKLAFRDACEQAGLSSIRYKLINSMDHIVEVLEDQTWPFPSVLKPRKGAGSWHIRKIESRSELMKEYKALEEKLLGGLFPKSIKEAGFILEEYFGGEEVDIDGWASKGEVGFQLVSDNYPAQEPFFLEQGGNYPSQLPRKAIVAFENLTKEVLKIFPGVHGCFHFEAKINLENMKLLPIEFNCRIGGAECPLSFEAVTGFDLPTVATQLSLSLPIPCLSSPLPDLPGPVHKVVCSTNLYPDKAGILIENRQDTGAVNAKLVTCVLFQGSVGKQVVVNNGSVSCLGWASAGGDCLEEAKLNLEKVIQNIHIKIKES